MANTDTPRIQEATKKDVDKQEPPVKDLSQDEQVLPPRQALINLRRHMLGVVETIDRTLRHAEKTKV